MGARGKVPPTPPYLVAVVNGQTSERRDGLLMHVGIVGVCEGDERLQTTYRQGQNDNDTAFPINQIESSFQIK